MQKFSFYATITSAIFGGILFGYNTAIISGVIVFLSKTFPLTPLLSGVIVSIALIGAIFGSWIAGRLADRFGRRYTLLIGALLFLIGILPIIFLDSIQSILWGRIFTGIALGISSVVSPLYLSEMAPAEKRGAYVSMYQIAIALGVLLSYLVNYELSFNQSWKWALSLGALPAGIQILGAQALLESPKWLKKPLYKSRSFGMHKPLVIGLTLSLFQQIMGVNVVFYYAPQIFEESGFSMESVSFLATMGIGAINLLSTLLTVWLIDRIGRKKLLLWSSAGMCLCLFVLAWTYFSSFSFDPLLSFISLLLYVCFFAIGIGPVLWVVLGEIFPLSIRGKALGLALFVNWAANYLISLTFPLLKANIGLGKTFICYAVVSALAFWFIQRYLVETKGKTLEEIEKLMIK